MNLPDGYLLQKGKYKLTQVIGQGGFGITYKGVWFTEVKGSLGAMRTEVPVCIKEYFFKDYCVRDPQSYIVKVHSDTGKLLFHKFKEKLIKEAKILSEVHHPYIVNVLEVFEENNTAYIAMEYISGNSLKDKLAKEGMLPEAEVLRYVHQIGEALQFVHQKNILHLDIKPSNILIDKDNNARLIDFGVSKRYDVGEQETSTTMLTLSKGFASIEQYDNEGIQSFTPCPDIYSLGATMYNLLTGKIPTESILRATRPLIPPHELNPNISEKTEAVIMKAMEIIPANRYQSIAEMMAELDFSKESVSQGTNIQSVQNREKKDILTHSNFQSDVDDETIVNTPEEELTQLSPTRQEQLEPEIHKDKKKLKVGIVSIAFLILAGGAASWYLYTENSQPNVALDMPTVESVSKGKTELPQPETKQSQKDESREEPTAVSDNQMQEKPKEQMPQTQGKKQSKPKTNEGKTNTEEKKNKSVTTPSSAQSVKKEEHAASTTNPSTSLIDTQYAKWLNLGKDKMTRNDYVGAREDLTNAKNMKVTEEVVRLLVVCEEQIKEKYILDKKAQYIEMMSFGAYTIVRKKSNNRYGAIDINGNERIPCKYLSVGKTDNGRAFEREDNLFDIYGSDGNVITKGATYY